ncbi:hypothetical protein BKA69DRAFT_763670 [Paraphysoderma sedebokerense]|nr:hypothetical protein BKA69DRAFT_763670 [Paraphysoderma sedebokerense]
MTSTSANSSPSPSRIRPLSPFSSSSPSSVQPSIVLPPGLQRLLDTALKSQLDIQKLVAKLQGLATANQPTANGNDGVNNLTREWQDLNSLVRTELKTLGSLVEDIERLNEEVKNDNVKGHVKTKIGECNDKIQQTTITLRKLNIQIKQTIDKLALEERRLLLGISSSSSSAHGGNHVNEFRKRGRGNSAKVDDESLLKTSSEVTESLRRMNQIMSVELDKSVANISALVLRTSKNLITKLEQRDWTDKLLIFFAIAVFVLVVLYILKKRVWGSFVAVGGWGWALIPL